MPRTNYCGVLNINKPNGPTSREIVNRVQKLVRPAKVGHAGTLDPMATGVLVVCVGHATRLINLVQEGRKVYRARFLLGRTSNTDDVTGIVAEGGPVDGITRERIEELLPDFQGRIQQVPPQFSAVHVDGQRAYDLARSGQSVELEARSIDVHDIKLTEYLLPEFELQIECGSGTYVRSIGRDLGQALGCGAVMINLERLSVGPFNVKNAVSPDDLTPDSLNHHLQSPLVAIPDVRQLTLTEEQLTAMRCGQTIAIKPELIVPAKSAPKNRFDNRLACIRETGQLIGICDFDPATRRMQPRIVFPTDY